PDAHRAPRLHRAIQSVLRLPMSPSPRSGRVRAGRVPWHSRFDLRRREWGVVPIRKAAMTRPGAAASRRARLARRGRILLAVAGAVLLSGCSLLPVGEDPSTDPSDQATTTQAAPRKGTLLPEGAAAIDVTAGESVQVSLPEGSLGVGDYWGVVSVGDPAIVEADVAIGEEVFGV